jgi:hypothetical protein
VIGINGRNAAMEVLGKTGAPPSSRLRQDAHLGI